MVLKFCISGVILALGVAVCGDSTAYTLYRGSVVGDHLRIHIAAFDASDGATYNRENCQTAANLFARQPGVSVRYWCEKGGYRR
ncbi:hypothetical protein ACLF3G_28315 [Falsiroseomonas sp. HC035]|uniref:hypothetical protein n=1 Tax=Falsiroseomonas sp. HC035 TaxID=3390999 RepID=UPI003D31B388